MKNLVLAIKGVDIMSWYKAIRVKCIIKEEFRKDFEPIALHGKWGSSSHPVLRNFGYSDDEDDEEAAFIPTHRCNFPIDWDGCDEEGEEYETKWNPETGEWIFACSVNSIRCSIIRDFADDITPIIVDHFIKYEFWIEPLSDEDSYDPVDITDYMNSYLNYRRR